MPTLFSRPGVPVIEMRGISVASRDNPFDPILENLDWTVNSGDYWVLGGLEGSGKTSFLELAAALNPPLAGEYRLFGCPMPTFGDENLTERLRIGLVLEDGHLLHRLTVLENVALPLRYHREMAGAEFDERIQRVVEFTGIGPHLNRLPGTLNRSWQRRAGLARALVLHPQILLLDNMLAGLDTRHIRWWLDTLDQLSDGRGLLPGQPLTLVVATDDLRPWQNRSVHLAVFHRPRFISLGRRALLSGHTHELVREMLAEHDYTPAA